MILSSDKSFEEKKIRKPKIFVGISRTKNLAEKN